MKIISKHHICESRKAIKRITKTIVFLFIVCVLISCNGDDKPERVERTTFVYFPWTTNLTGFFYNNIDDIQAAVRQIGLNGDRLVIYLATTESEATLFEIVRKSDGCHRYTLKQYSAPQVVTSNTLSSLLSDVKRLAPAKTYAMIIGSHGMGWLTSTNDDGNINKTSATDTATLTDSRYFGGLSSQYRIDISTLLSSLTACGMRMQYILFSGCYMSSLEAIYDLRTVTDYVIASPTEVMAVGMPFKEITAELLSHNPDYNAVCETFYRFYSKYQDPYGTIAVTDCRQLDSLAAIMKRINATYSFDAANIENIQRMDGYNPTIFYDYADYVKYLCASDTVLYKEFLAQMNKTVPYKAHTKEFYSARCGVVPINAYSGITTSEPSGNPKAFDHNQTTWYRDTH